MSPDSLRVRAATPDDLPAILDIYNHAVLHSTCTADYEPHTLAMRVEWFAQRTEKGFPVFVAEQTDTAQIAGWSAYGPYHSRIGYRFTVENSVYVDHERRGQGVGKLLLAPLIEHATANGFHSIIASIDGKNEASIRLHAGFGFERVGHFKEAFTKFGQWLDLVYMQKSLSSPQPVPSSES